MLRRFFSNLHGVSLLSLKLFVEIYEREKTLNKDEPVKKLKGRGAVRADGMQDFNPDSNVKLTR
jgi:hypothetical protein